LIFGVLIQLLISTKNDPTLNCHQRDFEERSKCEYRISPGRVRQLGDYRLTVRESKLISIFMQLMFMDRYAYNAISCRVLDIEMPSRIHCIPQGWSNNWMGVVKASGEIRETSIRYVSEMTLKNSEGQFTYFYRIVFFNLVIYISSKSPRDGNGCPSLSK
jgi:hypothetical protein